MAIPPRHIVRRKRVKQDEEVFVGLLGLWFMRRRQPGRVWVWPWILRMQLFGQYDTLMVELERESQGDNVIVMRMELAMFHELPMRLTLRLTKADTNWRNALDPVLKLAIMLQYFSTGHCYYDLAYAFQVPHNSISTFLTDVCHVIVSEYGDAVVKMMNKEGWCVVIKKFTST